MYLDFYGLAESPFNLTPDTNFLFPSRVHREVLAHLLYGVNSRKGFIMVSGEVGSGKTTLCRALLMKLGPNTEVALVLNSFLSELELLKTINEDLGIRSTGGSKKELIDELNNFLLDRRMKGKNVVLVIDEAQNLSLPVLEQIRMLSNLETEKEKLLQIVLVGQPELRRLLGSPRLRQLNQRITVRHHITPLTRKETVQYIYHRLKVAGSSGNIVFTNSALSEIYRFSGGIPRMINVICDQALLAGYVANSTRIDRKMVRGAEREIEGYGTAPSKAGKTAGREFSMVRVGATVGLILAMCLIGLTALRPVIKKALFPEETSLSGLRPRIKERVQGRPQTPDPGPETAPPKAGERGVAGSAPAEASEPPTETAHAPQGGMGRTTSLMWLAFLEGATTRLGQTLPDPLDAEMEPLSSREPPALTTLPPRPNVELVRAVGLPQMEGAAPRIAPAETSDRRVVAYRSFVEPMFALMRLWNRAPALQGTVRERYREVGEHLPSLAGAANMGWMVLRADMQMLRMVDLPAIVEVIGEGAEQKGYVALVAMGETWAEVTTAEGTKKLGIQLFSEIFTGNAIVLCDDSFVDPTPLREGEGISLSVRKLQDYMRKAGYYEGNPSGWFTPATTAAVMAFQREHGLPPSGEADGRTKLLLYCSQGRSEVPRLCSLQ